MPLLGRPPLDPADVDLMRLKTALTERLANGYCDQMNMFSSCRNSSISGEFAWSNWGRTSE